MSINLLNRLGSRVFSLNLENGVMSVRYISKSPGQSQRGNRRPPKNFKLNYIPGERVAERTILNKQNSLRYHPGFNVALDPKNKSLYSLCSGTVFYSIEKFNPNPKSHFVEKFYCQQIRPKYKKYIHVITDNNLNHFKLIDLI